VLSHITDSYAKDIQRSMHCSNATTVSVHCQAGYPAWMIIIDKKKMFELIAILADGIIVKDII